MAAPVYNEDPLFLFIKVPYICGYTALDNAVQFEDIPAQHGIPWEQSQNASSVNQNLDEAAVFLQHWLFFGTLNRVCSVFEIEFEPFDFVDFSTTPTGSLTGTAFFKYVWLWHGGMNADFNNMDQTERIRKLIHALGMTADAWSLRIGNEKSPKLALVLLSLVLLWDRLKDALYTLLTGPSSDDMRSLSVINYPEYGRKLLMEAGWCIGEIPSLVSTCAPAILLFLSKFNRKRKERDHSRCSWDNCKAGEVDLKTYKTAHAPDCTDHHSCILVHSPLKQVCDILEVGFIPVVHFEERDLSSGSSLHAIEFPLSQTDTGGSTLPPKYVAISHVWSDGMGNPRANALHICQLRRIQRAVNSTYSSDGSAEENYPFWIDTICVPLEPKMRTLAITRMAKTYFHADKVLVMDNWVAEESLSNNRPRDILFKILHSDWNSRLWTFQETVLARKRYFELADTVTTHDEITLRHESTDFLNVARLSNFLAEMRTDKLLGTKSTLNLAQALATIEPHAPDESDHFKSLVSLPSQENPNLEVDRLAAIQANRSYELECRLLEQWFPILAGADCLSKDPEGASVRLNRLRTLRLEPISHHVSSRLELLGDIGYEFTASRSEDLARGGNRQITSLNQTPSDNILFAMSGVRGRKTSRREDETICLAGSLGLDVTPLLAVKIDEKKRTEQVDRICEDRMKIFLAMVKIVPLAILSTTSKRLTTYPWRWAPASFLNHNFDFTPFSPRNAECTAKGLFFRCHGFQIPASLHVDDQFRPETRTFKVNFTVKEQSSYHPGDGRPPNRQQGRMSEVIFEVRPSNGSAPPENSLYSIFSSHEDSLALLIPDETGFLDKSSILLSGEVDAILVKILETKNDIHYAYYLLNLFQVHPDLPQNSGPTIDVVRIFAKWCVG